MVVIFGWNLGLGWDVENRTLPETAQFGFAGIIYNAQFSRSMVCRDNVTDASINVSVEPFSCFVGMAFQKKQHK
jgi:hypothetical protein